MAKFIMLAGLPGSGKSTYANELARKDDFIVHSSDVIRAELGDVNDQSKNDEVFVILHKRIKADLRNGKNVVYDATNLNRKRRIAFLRELKNIPCEKHCVLVAAPFEICLSQNKQRDRIVPEEVMHRMYRSFQMPCTQEGFDSVEVYYSNETWKEYYGDIIAHLWSLQDFDQCNHHHTLSLGKHMAKAASIVLIEDNNCSYDVLMAAYSHDIGKVDTKAFTNMKGEPTEEAHFYSHQNVGAYKSLFFAYPSFCTKQYIALLIELHMNPWLAWEDSEKAYLKDLELFGEKVISGVELIHVGDECAH